MNLLVKLARLADWLHDGYDDLAVFGIIVALVGIAWRFGVYALTGQ